VPARVAVVLVVLLLLATGPLAASSDARVTSIGPWSAAPDTVHQRVDVGGYKLYVECVGTGTPTVLLDDAGYLDVWQVVQQKVGAFTRTCSYDRAGMGLSDPGPTPITTAHLARDLHRLLTRAHIPGPFILVGNAFGGTTVRLFSSRYGKGVAGVVLLDAIPPQLLSGDTVNGYYVDFDTSRRQVESAGPLGALPLVVLSHGIGLTLPETVERKWGRYERGLAGLSSNSVYIIASRSGYGAMPLLQSGLVVAAIQEVMLAMRSPSHRLEPCGFSYVVYGARCL